MIYSNESLITFFSKGYNLTIVEWWQRVTVLDSPSSHTHTHTRGMLFFSVFYTLLVVGRFFQTNNEIYYFLPMAFFTPNNDQFSIHPLHSHPYRNFFLYHEEKIHLLLFYNPKCSNRNYPSVAKIKKK